MDNQPASPSQNGGGVPSPGNEGNQSQPVLNTTHSDLAQSRAQRQGSAPATAQQPVSGQGVPNTQESQQRSEYIPRDRFDEVNQKRIAAEAQLQQLQAMTQAQMHNAHQANAGQAPSGQQVMQTPAVQNFLASVSDKAEQEKWRQKIVNQPVTGIAELIQHAIQTEGAALLQTQLQQLQTHLAPLQNFYQQQQVAAVEGYVKQRATDPNWVAVQPLFQQLAQQAQQQGYQLSQENLQIIESVARTRVGVPVWGTQAVPAPFTERPHGQPGVGTQAPPAQVTPQIERMARVFGMSPEAYARTYNVAPDRVGGW